MSTLKTTNLQHPSSSVVNMTLASDGSVSGGLPAPNRNLLYNGAMNIAQRGASSAGWTTASYLIDRWMNDFSSLGTWTISQESDGPSGSGFAKSLKYLCTTANASPSAAAYMWCSQRLEGQDLQRIAKGTSSAQPLTLSFWVKSNVTGTFNAMLYDPTADRIIAKQYTISTSGTWERKVLTVPGDTVGALANTNTYAFSVYFAVAAGSNFTSGTSTGWAANTGTNVAPGQVNTAAAVNNYWQLTGVQLEPGNAPTSFDFKTFSQDLAACQRYYEKSYDVSVVPGTAAAEGCVFITGGTDGNSQVGHKMSFKVPKRTSTYTVYAWSYAGVANSWYYAKSSASGTVATQYAYKGNSGFLMYSYVGTAFTACVYEGHWAVDAEL